MSGNFVIIGRIECSILMRVEHLVWRKRLIRVDRSADVHGNVRHRTRIQRRVHLRIALRSLHDDNSTGRQLTGYRPRRCAWSGRHAGVLSE